MEGASTTASATEGAFSLEHACLHDVFYPYASITDVFTCTFVGHHICALSPGLVRAMLACSLFAHAPRPQRRRCKLSVTSAYILSESFPIGFTIPSPAICRMGKTLPLASLRLSLLKESFVTLYLLSDRLKNGVSRGDTYATSARRWKKGSPLSICNNLGITLKSQQSSNIS